MAEMTAEQVNAELMGHAELALGGKGAMQAAAEAQNAEATKAAAAKAEADKAAADAAAKAGSGKGEKKETDEGGYKNPSDAKNFRALREVTEAMKETARLERERADRLEKELQTLRNPPKKDPLEEAIEKMDPNERKRLEATGVMPLILAGLDARKEAAALTAKVGEIDSDRQTRAAAEAAQKTLLAGVAQYGEEKNYDDARLDALTDIVAEGKVTGRTIRDLLDNADEILELRLKAQGTSPGKTGGDAEALARAAAKAAAGGADASAGSAAPPPTGSKKELMAKYDELRANDPAAANRALIEAMTRPSDLRRLAPGIL